MIRSFYYNFTAEDGNYATIASENKVIPIFRAHSINRETYIYYDFDPKSVQEHNYIANTITRIRSCFHGRQGRAMRVTLPKDVKVVVGEGFVIREQDNSYLLLVGIRSESIDKSHWEPEDYILYYSLELLTDPLLSTLNKRLQKELLTDAVKEGIEVIVTEAITIRKNAFAKVMSIRFSTVDIMQHYFKEVLPKAFFSSGSNTDLVESFDPGFSLKPIEVTTALEVQEEYEEVYPEVDYTEEEEDSPSVSYRMDILDLSQGLTPQEEAEILQDLADIEARIEEEMLPPENAVISEQEAQEMMEDLSQIVGTGRTSFNLVVSEDVFPDNYLPLPPSRIISTVELIDDTE